MSKIWLLLLIALPSFEFLSLVPHARAQTDCTRTGFRWGFGSAGSYEDPYNWPTWGHGTQDTLSDITSRWSQLATASASIGIGWYRGNLNWKLIQPTIPSPVGGASSYADYLTMSESQISPIVDEYAFPTDSNNPFGIDLKILPLQDAMVDQLGQSGICFVGILARGTKDNLPFDASGVQISPDRMGSNNYLGLVYLFSRAMVRRYSPAPHNVLFWQVENELDIAWTWALSGWRSYESEWLNPWFLISLIQNLNNAVKLEAAHVGRTLWTIANYASFIPAQFIGAPIVDYIGVDEFASLLNIPPYLRISYPSYPTPLAQGLLVGSVVAAAKALWNKPVWVTETGYPTESWVCGIVTLSCNLPESEQADYTQSAASSALAAGAVGYSQFSATSPEKATAPFQDDSYGIIKPTRNSDGTYGGTRNTPAWTTYANVIANSQTSSPSTKSSDTTWPTVGEVPVEDFTNPASPEQWSITSTDPQISSGVYSLQDWGDANHPSNGDHSIWESGNSKMSTDFSTVFTNVQKITGVSAIHVETSFGLNCNDPGSYSSADVAAYVQIYDENSYTVTKQWTASQCGNVINGWPDYWFSYSDDLLLNSGHQYSVRLVAWNKASAISSGIILHYAFWKYVHISINDFGVSAKGANDPNYVRTFAQGASAHWGMNYNSVGSFQSPVTLSSSWDSPSPSGISISFDQPTANPSPGSDSARTVTISTSTTTPTGNYRLHITGATTFGLAHDAWFNINVQNDCGSTGEAGKSFNTATPIAPGTCTGYLNSDYDTQDWYSFNVPGSPYTISVIATSPSTAAFNLELYNPNGAMMAVAYPTYNGAVPTITYPVCSGGSETWATRVFIPSWEVAQGTYTLSLSITSGATCGGGGGGGSVLAGTRMLMSDGTWVPVQNLAPGMTIRSYDRSQDRFFDATLTSILVKTVDNLYVISTGNGNPIRVDYYENFWVQLPSGQEEWMHAGELQLGYKILMPTTGAWSGITSIQTDTGSFTVYDLVFQPTLPGGVMPDVANGYLIDKCPISCPF